MKVKCISNRQAGHSEILDVTVDKIYHVYDMDASGYRIIDDRGRIGMYWIGRFRIATAESRNEALEKLGI